MPPNAPLKELDPIEVPDTSKGSRHELADLGPKAGAGKKKREYAELEVVNEHNFEITILADGDQRRRVSARSRVTWDIPGNADWVAIDATGGKIVKGNVVVTPRLAISEAEAEYFRQRGVF